MGQEQERKQKPLKGKFIPKHETEQDWNQSNYVPAEGELVVYDQDNNYPYPRIKKGDGVNKVKDLPFVSDPYALSFVREQILTTEQKQMAKSNLGLLDELSKKADLIDGKVPVSQLPEDVLRYSDQTLTEEEKSQALQNLGVNDFVSKEMAELIDSAPDALNTLQELAAALGNDPNFATTMITEISKKVDKVAGKGLSTNDFTDAYKEKVDLMSGDVDVTVSLDNISNALKANAAGNPVILSDASPLRHKIEVFVTPAKTQKTIITHDQIKDVDPVLHEEYPNGGMIKSIVQATEETDPDGPYNYIQVWFRMPDASNSYFVYDLSNSVYLKEGNEIIILFSEDGTIDYIDLLEPVVITKIEEGLDPVSYTVEKDGSVKDVIREGEGQVRLSSDDNVLISVEYNKDINKGLPADIATNLDTCAQGRNFKADLSDERTDTEDLDRNTNYEWRRILNVIRGSSGRVEIALYNKGTEINDGTAINLKNKGAEFLSFDFTGFVEHKGFNWETPNAGPKLVKNFDHHYRQDEDNPGAYIQAIRIGYPDREEEAGDFPIADKDGEYDSIYNPVNCYIDVKINKYNRTTPSLLVNYTGFSNSHNCFSINSDTQKKEPAYTFVNGLPTHELNDGTVIYASNLEYGMYCEKLKFYEIDIEDMVTYLTTNDLPVTTGGLSNNFNISRSGAVPMELNDVSPIQHRIKFKIDNKNLLQYSVTPGKILETDNGASYVEVKKDGTVVMTGSFGRQYPSLISDSQRIELQPGTYTLSGCPTGGSETTYRLVGCYKTTNTIGSQYEEIVTDYGAGCTFTVQHTVYFRLYISIGSSDAESKVYDHVLFKPQLEKTKYATPFVPFQKRVVGQYLYVGSKNILPYPYFSLEASPTTNICGATFRDNQDGSITINGTVKSGSGSARRFYFSKSISLKKGVTYTLSLQGQGLSQLTKKKCALYLYKDSQFVNGMDGKSGINLWVQDSITFTAQESVEEVWCYLHFADNDQTFTDCNIVPVLEIGATKTKYTPYHKEKLYVTGLNGEIGVPSFSPYLVAYVEDQEEDEPIHLVCDYNRDISKEPILETYVVNSDDEIDRVLRYVYLTCANNTKNCIKKTIVLSDNNRTTLFGNFVTFVTLNISGGSCGTIRAITYNYDKTPLELTRSFTVTHQLPGSGTLVIKETELRFGEWCWVNPPMISGVEYRTTELCEGKPVYIKAQYGIPVPKNDDSYIVGLSFIVPDVGKVISLTGTVYSYTPGTENLLYTDPLPTLANQEGQLLHTIAYCEATNQCIKILCEPRNIDRKISIVIKYYK